MKVAIAADGKDENAMISERAARAPYILIFEDKKLIKAIRNPFAFGGGGAGFSVAYMLANEKIDLFIAGRIGPNMAMALKEKSIAMKTFPGKTVKQVLESL